jgi:Uri superfamily endonuclease
MILATGDDGNELPKAPGAYILTVALDQPLRLALPGMKDTVLEAGRYAYCGSAHGPGGIRARVRRHLRRDKKPHWHIDRLTGAGRIATIHAVPGGRECALFARILALPGAAAPIPGFGSSDCRRCIAHLVRLAGTAYEEAIGEISQGGEIWRPTRAA